ISKCNETDAEHYSEIVAIKVDPRKKLKNGNNSVDHYAKINKKRRQTIEIAPMKRVEDFRPTSNETLVEKSPLLIEDVTNDTNRKNDKENSISRSLSIYEKIFDTTGSYQCHSAETLLNNLQSSSSKDPAGSTLKQFFKRTLSLRLPSSDKPKKNNAAQQGVSKKFTEIYENLPLRKERHGQKIDDDDHYDELKSVKKDSKRKSSAILSNRLSCNNTVAKYKQLSPSASSHDSAYSSCDQKAKRSSFDSSGSMTSLDLNTKWVKSEKFS
uniref:Exophilin 5 n=1 Tax=Romanomermis culicivorax TaxID=13658 RepID=A0A915HQP7_ROMCU